MIAVDTNLLLRVILNDDVTQTAASLRILQGDEPVMLLNTVLLETAWVLSSVYDKADKEIVEVLADIVAKPTIILESPQIVLAIQWYGSGMDFADAIHLAGAADRQCDTLLTFDKAFARRARGRTACTVAKPA